MELTFENRLNLNENAGSLIHVFGEGYSIIDEYGKEVNTFNDEHEFNRLTAKFRYRHFLIEKLNETQNDKFDFGEDNNLYINDKAIKDSYWDLPKNEDEVGLFFDYLSDKFIYKLNWEFLLENIDFFNQLFSSYFPFKEDELIEYRYVLSIGSPSFEIDTGAIASKFGLIFNSHINWTSNLKQLYYQEPYLLWAGGGYDEYSHSIDFEKLPLSFNEELESIKSNSRNTMISGHLYDYEKSEEESLIKEMNELENYYANIEKQQKFNKQELINITKNRSYEFISNINVYIGFINKIKEDICGFTVQEYYEKYKKVNNKLL